MVRIRMTCFKLFTCWNSVVYSYELYLNKAVILEKVNVLKVSNMVDIIPTISKSL